MARPKTGRPPKVCLNLTVDEKTKKVLKLIGEHRQQSISSMVEQWAYEEADRLQIDISQKPSAIHKKTKEGAAK